MQYASTLAFDLKKKILNAEKSMWVEQRIVITF